MSRLRNWIDHISNPLHIMCRLIDLGLKPKTARRIVLAYERLK